MEKTTPLNLFSSANINECSFMKRQQ